MKDIRFSVSFRLVLKRIRSYFLYVFIPLIFNSVTAQETPSFKPRIDWNIKAQFWLRYSDLNEGSLVNNELTDTYTDLSMRRLRIPISSQITPKIFVYSIFGGNNYNFRNKDFAIQVLDLYLEYAFDKAFEIGIGKSGWQGLNRWNVRSNTTLMGLDSPLFTLNSVEINDDLGRMFGVWLKGQFHKFDYRLTFNRPFIVTKVPNGKVDFANNRPRIKTSTYIKYQFFEEESNKSAYHVGTYLQSKKVFHLGLGYQFQSNAMSDGDAYGSTTNFYDMEHWAVDAFLNLPLRNQSAITAYLGYYDYNFGENYIRNLGANNVSTQGGTDFNGPGVAFPMIGTGESLYFQLGYAFPKITLCNKPMVIQPNIAIQHSNWEALQNHMIVYDYTVNFLPNGTHGRKISLGYQYRPIFDEVNLERKGYKGMAVLQLQFSLK